MKGQCFDQEAGQKGMLNLNDDRSIKSFAEKPIVTEERVVNVVRYIHENTVPANLCKKERSKQTQPEKEKKFGDYDWQKLVKERTLDTLTVYELDKYLNVHNICITKQNKSDKIKLIIAHHESGKSVLVKLPWKVTLIILVALPIQINIVTLLSCTP